MSIRIPLFLVTIFLVLGGCQHPAEQTTTDYDVIILGGGAGGTAAGIQAARQGANTLIVEQTPWLGGMLTAAGVSAIDGNHALPAGLWGEFRDSLYRHYGGPGKVATGWVSHTLFEPATGALILATMAKAEDKLTVMYNAAWTSIEREGQGWKITLSHQGESRHVTGSILIDGTDLGDVAAAAGAGYDLGMDSREATGESMAPAAANDIIQDLTYVATLKDYGEGADRTIARPEGYDPAEFSCSCSRNCPDGSYDLSCAQMLDYGRLPNGKYMINWPNRGNDFYANVVEAGTRERYEAYQEAKAKTLRFVYYIQHELGYRHLGLADDEYPTTDSLPLIPYHREGRRIHGLTRMNVNHILTPYTSDAPLYRTAIAVGDYPIDHHHKERPDAPAIDFPPVPSFGIPAGCLIPADVDGLIVADKAISVTNIVNGSTRLQPVILQVGQAAGVMAAIAAGEGISPSSLPVRRVQDSLLAYGAYLLPFYDVPPTHPHFPAIQRVAASGLLRGTGQPYQWANRTWFYPDSLLSTADAMTGLAEFAPGINDSAALVSGEDALNLLVELAGKLGINAPELKDTESLQKILTENERYDWLSPGAPLTRTQWAVLLDDLIDPFHYREVGWQGEWK